MGLIVPGRNVVCIRAIACPCGCAKATQGAFYMCEKVGWGGLIHEFFCTTEGCDGMIIQLTGKIHCLCVCCFAPLDDGDTSLVAKEEEDPQVVTEPERIDA